MGPFLLFYFPACFKYAQVKGMISTQQYLNIPTSHIIWFLGQLRFRPNTKIMIIEWRAIIDYLPCLVFFIELTWNLQTYVNKNLYCWLHRSIYSRTEATIPCFNKLPAIANTTKLKCWFITMSTRPLLQPSQIQSNEWGWIRWVLYESLLTTLK